MHSPKYFTSDFWTSYVSREQIYDFLTLNPSKFGVNFNQGTTLDRTPQFSIISQDSNHKLKLSVISEMDSKSTTLRPKCLFPGRTEDLTLVNCKQWSACVNSLDLESIYTILLKQAQGWKELAQHTILELIDQLIGFNTQLLFNSVSYESQLIELVWLYSYLAMNMCLLFPKRYTFKNLVPVDYRDITKESDVRDPSKWLKLFRLTELNWTYLDILRKHFVN